MKSTKNKKALPLLIITDEITGYSRQYVPCSFVITALQGLAMTSMTSPVSLLDEIKRLLTEIEGAEKGGE